MAPDGNSDDVRTLKQSEQYYRDLVDATSDALFVHDETGRILAVNAQMCAMYGCTREEALASSVGDMSANVPPYTQVEAAAHVERAQREGEARFEWHSRRRNGELFWSEVMLRSASLAGTVRVIASVRDISKRKQDEAALRESEARFQKIFNSSSNAIAFSEPVHGRILDVNETWLRATGLTKEQAIGKSALELGLWANTNDRVRLLEMVKNAQPVRGVVTALRLKDVDRLFETSSELIEVGGQRYILWEFHDITERRKAEAEQELLRAQLYQAQKMESVGRLAGGVAHDFNNLLTVILSLVKMLGDVPRSDQEADDLRQIGAAAERASDLTQQLLAFARRQIVEPRVLDLNQLVHNLDRMLRRLIGEDIVLKTVCQPKLGAVRADPGQIEQVLMNLVVNARDAMESGGTLTIETANATLGEDYSGTHPDITAGDYVMISVSDTGSGMNADTLSHVFEPFFTTKSPGKGTGLGLATCYGIIKQNGGSIYVYSEVGRGSTFKLFLPRIWEQAALHSDHAPAAPARGSETVLVVEDDEMVRKIAVRILTSKGYTVHPASDGVEALGVFDKIGGAVDILVTDVVMPNMSGKELAAELRRRQPTLRILYTSGYTENTIVHHGIVDASIDFLPKPYVPSELLRRVREVLDRVQH